MVCMCGRGGRVGWGLGWDVTGGGCWDGMGWWGVVVCGVGDGVGGWGCGCDGDDGRECGWWWCGGS